MDIQVARPQALGMIWGRGDSGTPSRPSPSGAALSSASLILQPWGGSGGTEGGGGAAAAGAGGEGYRLYCSEDFEQHVIRFLTRHALVDGSPEEQEGGGGARGKGMSGGPAFRIYSPAKVREYEKV